jgi:O-antigen/teichoic acid export membrane protein
VSSLVVKNIGYNAVSKFLTIAVQVLTTAILARNLSPDDFGLVGIATIVTGLMGQLSNCGLNSALVQRRTIDENVLQTAQVLNLIFACALFLCTWLCAPFLTLIFHNADVPRVVGVLAFCFLISAVGFLPSALLTREMRFARLRAPDVTGILAKGIVSVGCALAGLRYWSLVAGLLAANLSNAVLLRIVRPCKIKWRLDPNIAFELLKYGTPLLGSGLLVFLTFNVDNFMIGSLMGTKELGYYAIAFTWSSYICGALGETVHSVLFPRFSQMQLNRVELAEMYCRSLRAVVFLAVMVNAVLFSVADGFLFTVLGKGSPRWLPSLYPLRVLCVYGSIRAAVEPIGNVIMALGRTRLLLWAVLLVVVPEICFLPHAIAKWGLTGVALLVTGTYSIQWVLYGPFLNRELGVNTLTLLKLVFPAMAAAVAGVLVSRWLPLADPFSWASIIIRSVTVCFSYVLAHELLTRGSMVAEVYRVLKRNAPGQALDETA